MDAKAIRDLRLRLGITQRQLGDQIGVDQGTVSRWERGIESPRPSRHALLRRLALANEDLQNFNRSLAVVRNDLLPSTLLDSDLRLLEMSKTGEKFLSGHRGDPTKLRGLSFRRYVERLGVTHMMRNLTESGFLEGNALFFRFTVNSRGFGNTTLWEPILKDGELFAVLNYVTAVFDFPANDEFSVEHVDFVPSSNPSTTVTLHRGERADFI